MTSNISSLLFPLSNFQPRGRDAGQSKSWILGCLIGVELINLIRMKALMGSLLP